MTGGHYYFNSIKTYSFISEEHPYTAPISIEERTIEHRASVRKMVWIKILMSIGLSIIGFLLPFFVKIHYIPYLGISLRFTAFILMIQGFRTLRAYAKVNKKIVPKKTYNREDMNSLSEVVTIQIEQNTIEQRLALAGLIISVIVSVMTVLSQEYVLIAASFIPIALILAIEFCFTLVLIHVQMTYKRRLDKVEL